MGPATSPNRRPSRPLAAALAAGTALLLAAPAAGTALPAPLADQGPDDPAGTVQAVRDAACTSATDGTILMRPPSTSFVRPFSPPCIVAENEERITWENHDRGAHDPGDGVEDEREQAFCFQAAVDVEDRNAVEPGETYSIQLRFDAGAETLHLEKAWHDGELQDLDGDDPGLGTIECDDHAWTWQDEGVIAVDYMCHLHDNGDGRILLEV